MKIIFWIFLHNYLLAQDSVPLNLKSVINSPTDEKPTQYDDPNRDNVDLDGVTKNILQQKIVTKEPIKQIEKIRGKDLNLWIIFGGFGLLFLLIIIMIITGGKSEASLVPPNDEEDPSSSTKIPPSKNSKINLYSNFEECLKFLDDNFIDHKDFNDQFKDIPNTIFQINKMKDPIENKKVFVFRKKYIDYADQREYSKDLFLINLTDQLVQYPEDYKQEEIENDLINNSINYEPLKNILELSTKESEFSDYDKDNNAYKINDEITKKFKSFLDPLIIDTVNSIRIREDMRNKIEQESKHLLNFTKYSIPNTNCFISKVQNNDYLLYHNDLILIIDLEEIRFYSINNNQDAMTKVDLLKKMNFFDEKSYFFHKDIHDIIITTEGLNEFYQKIISIDKKEIETESNLDQSLEQNLNQMIPNFKYSVQDNFSISVEKDPNYNIFTIYYNDSWHLQLKLYNDKSIQFYHMSDDFVDNNINIDNTLDDTILDKKFYFCNNSNYWSIEFHEIPTVYKMLQKLILLIPSNSLNEVREDFEFKEKLDKLHNQIEYPISNDNDLKIYYDEQEFLLYFKDILLFSFNYENNKLFIFDRKTIQDCQEKYSNIMPNYFKSFEQYTEQQLIEMEDDSLKKYIRAIVTSLDIQLINKLNEEYHDKQFKINNTIKMMRCTVRYNFDDLSIERGQTIEPSIYLYYKDIPLFSCDINENNIFYSNLDDDFIDSHGIKSKRVDDIIKIYNRYKDFKIYDKKIIDYVKDLIYKIPIELIANENIFEDNIQKIQNDKEYYIKKTDNYISISNLDKHFFLKYNNHILFEFEWIVSFDDTRDIKITNINQALINDARASFPLKIPKPEIFQNITNEILNKEYKDEFFKYFKNVIVDIDNIPETSDYQ